MSVKGHKYQIWQDVVQTLPGLVLLVILLCLPIVLNDFALLEVTQWLIDGLLALSLTLVWGVGGVFSFGQTVFFGLAGYSYGIVSLNLSGWLGTLLGLLCGIVVALLVASFLGYFMFYGRISNLAVGIITLATTLIFYDLFNSMAGDQYRIGAAAIGGFNGMQRVPTLLNLEIIPHYLLVVIVSALVLAGLIGFRHCRLGRVLNAIRLNEVRTELLGYDTRAVKLIGFGIGGAIAGLAGVLHTSWGNTINPTVFGSGQAILVIILVLVGGKNHLWGAFLGATLLQSLSGFLGTFAQQATPIILGTTLVTIVLLLPGGIAPTLQQFWLRLSRWQYYPELPTLKAKVGGIENKQDRKVGSGTAPNLLEVWQLKRRFGSLLAVNNVNLTFQPGQAYSIIGPNGAGKSTFFNLLIGHLTTTTGAILYKGTDITHLIPHERTKRGISAKLQHPNVFLELSVYENLWLAVAVHYQDAATQSILIVEMLHEIALYDRLTQQADTLSHGEKQWLEIGMAAIAQPTLLLLDEPTAGMSRGEMLQTVALVKRLAQRSTVIVVEHDMEFVRQLGATVIVFSQGEVLTTGSVETVQQDARVLEIYLGQYAKPD
ncbi:ATP-binding cassette domain-containing protein [Phormidium sp. FACHB-592]|uniref:ATP-binding cassette domain-containing protein n=1 Tax=Stenomitos frigidus AS-A4 TaxID=2933935 RepID=A0ABV0KMI9_9CYAN|nr:ATP-binding cassette domain-containing protein [Phormidium sp. FACHB-592]MBD2077093.1 ATP-binding cassette domain-containing protein [Phormidium sp. FACHB-592]